MPALQLQSSLVSSRASCRRARAAVRAGAAPGDNGARRSKAGEALIHSLSGVHQSMGRAVSSTNLVLGIDNSEAAWRCIDKRVNSYPSLREFTAIGSGGSSFRHSMVAAVSAVVGQVEVVTQRCSAGGRYISVTVGPVMVSSADDVLEVYTRMKSDERLRYFL
ncbi:MAG: hypothetical protein J3K34DRAFT_403453 [Monoraphidium minutum]|nr:MAG: hypothetical protein J3K34DRAFT_403453 [Monoraphidium minutum]